VLFGVNLPFHWFGWRRMGTAFVAKTVIAVTMLSTLTWLMPAWVDFASIEPLFGAVLFGLVSGATALLFDARIVAVSAVESVVTNLVIAINHRPDRYLVT